MKKILRLFAVGLFIGSVALADSASVGASSVSFTNVRAEAIGAISGGPYYRGTTLIFTNCACMSDTAGIVTQGLDLVTVDINIGNTTTNTAYVGTTCGATTNFWWASTVVPDFITATISVQVKLTDSQTNIYIYPWKTLSHKEAME